LLFTDVQLDKWIEIERSFDRSSLRVHQFYDCMEQMGIIKLMPDPYHEAILGIFKPILYDELSAAGVGIFDYIHLGARRYVNRTGSRKEPDASWTPVGRARTDWAELVLEVGFSEGLNQLRRHAKWWLESSPAIVLLNGILKREVQQVIILHGSLSPMTLTIESWVLSPAPRITRNRPGFAVREHPTTTLTTTITNGFAVTLVTGQPTLSVKWEGLFDRAPPAGQGDFVISTPALQELANVFWKEAGP
jgi:hypothetical protein